MATGNLGFFDALEEPPGPLSLRIYVLSWAGAFFFGKAAENTGINMQIGLSEK